MLRSAVRRGGRWPMSRRSPRRRWRRCPGTSTTTWPSSWSAPRAATSLRGSARSRPSRSGSPRRAASARAVLIRWGVRAKQAELACLLVSEVVTNVVLHTTPAGQAAAPGRAGARLSAGPRAGVPPPVWEKEALRVAPPPPPKQFTLRLRRGAAAVWVEVFDTDLRLPRIRSADETDEGGRGCTWWTRSPAAGGRGRPRTARWSGSRCLSRTDG
mgnify:CR=1 FL=1